MLDGLAAVTFEHEQRPSRHSRSGGCCCWRSCASSRRGCCVTVLAIALGVALGAAVYLVNTSALNEFGLATKRLVGEADIVIRGPREGFDEQLVRRVWRAILRSARRVPCSNWTWRSPGAATRSRCSDSTRFAPPRCSPRSSAISATACFELFKPDSIYLSSAAAQDLKLQARRLAASHRRQLDQDAARARRVVANDLSAGAGHHGHCLRAMDFQCHRPPESHRSAARAGHGRRGACAAILAGRCRSVFSPSLRRSNATAPSPSPEPTG